MNYNGFTAGHLQGSLLSLITKSEEFNPFPTANSYTICFLKSFRLVHDLQTFYQSLCIFSIVILFRSRYFIDSGGRYIFNCFIIKWCENHKLVFGEISKGLMLQGFELKFSLLSVDVGCCSEHLKRVNFTMALEMVCQRYDSLSFVDNGYFL